MKQSFLDSLKGLLIDEAIQKVQEAGYKVFTKPNKVPISALARPDTVILSHDHSIVTHASAGDPLEITGR